MQLPERRPHRLARHFLPPLVEHPDDPVLRLLVVLGPHASFSPFAWKESLYQSQGGSGQRVSLPEHARSIREAAKAARKPQKPRKRFTQVLPDVGELQPIQAAPVVQTRSLAEYERLLESA